MTAVRVFVDDAIRGDLPLVCAKTGEPAELVIRMRQPVGGGIPGWVWFLFFFGPLGIFGLLVAALFSPATSRRRSHLGAVAPVDDRQLQKAGGRR